MGDSLTMPGQIAVIQGYAAGKKRLAEIGVCFGGTSIKLREVMAEDGELNLVDPFPADLNQTWNGKKLTPSLKLAEESVAQSTRGKVNWFVMTGETACKAFGPDSLDFVFIDGLHDEASVLLDWACWSPKVEKGGIVLFHDVANYCPGVKSAFAKIIATPGWSGKYELEMGVMVKL